MIGGQVDGTPRLLGEHTGHSLVPPSPTSWCCSGSPTRRPHCPSVLCKEGMKCAWAILWKWKCFCHLPRSPPAAGLLGPQVAEVSVTVG